MTPPRPEVSKPNPYDAEEILKGLRAFAYSLSPPDRLAAAGAALAILTGFLPWKETRLEGEVLGLFSLALPAILAAGCALAALTFRVQAIALDWLSTPARWMIQLTSSAFGILWTAAFMYLSYRPAKMPALAGNVQVALSIPSPGAYLGLFFLCAALLGTLWGIKLDRS